MVISKFLMTVMAAPRLTDLSTVRGLESLFWMDGEGISLHKLFGVRPFTHLHIISKNVIVIFSSTGHKRGTNSAATD